MYVRCVDSSTLVLNCSRVRARSSAGRARVRGDRRVRGVRDARAARTAHAARAAPARNARASPETSALHARRSFADKHV